MDDKLPLQDAHTAAHECDSMALGSLHFTGFSNLIRGLAAKAPRMDITGHAVNEKCRPPSSPPLSDYDRVLS